MNRHATLHRGLAAIIATSVISAQQPEEHHSVRYRSPEASMLTMKLPPGYRIELVASEPMIKEPVMCVWDARGRMFVAEMRSYVQDVDGTRTREPNSRISILEDTDGDGAMDAHTVFADGLVLPRLLLPLDDRVLVQETYDGILWSYRDTDDDGVADAKEVLFEYGASGANLEHQDSGLLWGIDNWLYTAFGKKRHRITPTGFVTEDMPGAFAQWGLAVDDVGRQFFASAGAERPAFDFQFHPVYGKPRIGGELGPGFVDVYGALELPDVQGGPGRLNREGKLNRFTGCCGQSVYRGDALPERCYGDYFLCEPVGRLVRRAEVRNEDGKRVLFNRYDRDEFLTSTDANFRPVWSDTGPDGCLYIVDMYRGIIQESNWVKEGSYLRPVVLKYGLDKNVGRGRIYRIYHERAQPAAVPNLLAMKSARLVEELWHRNGWRRDTAQRLIVLRRDESVVPALLRVVREGASALGRMHALWTLEGLGALQADAVILALGDTDARVRQAAVRNAEPWLRVNDERVVAAFQRLVEDPDVDVAVQVALSLRHLDTEAGRNLVIDTMLHRPESDMVRVAGNSTLKHGVAESAAPTFEFDAEGLALLRSGSEHYKTLCIACHAPDGAGMEAGDLLLGAPLDGSNRVNGNPDRLIRIVLHGLTGPIDGEAYPGNLMAPMAGFDDAWLAAVLTFVRNSWGNVGSVVLPADVARVREEERGRLKPWTLDELVRFEPIDREVMRRWTLSASHGTDDCHLAIDGDDGSRFTTRTSMRPGMWFRIDFDGEYQLDRLVLDTRGSGQDFPRGFVIEASDDGTVWDRELESGSGNGPITDIRIGRAKTRHVRIRNTGTSDSWWWSIHELQVYGSRQSD